MRDKQQIETLNTEIQALQNNEQAMCASTSRRLTEPLRMLRRRIKLPPRLQPYARKLRALVRRLRTPRIWTFDQYLPRTLRVPEFYRSAKAPAAAPRIAIVTPAYNHGGFIRATIDSVLDQNYPRLSYFVKDAGSKDGTYEVLSSYGSRLNWLSEPDSGQTNAINTGFRHVSGDIMGWLNSDDILLPGTLSYVSSFFAAHPHVDIVYGDRIIINRDGAEIGRVVLPRHDAVALRHADYIPQETMFWRRHVWESLGGLDEQFRFAMDWDFILRAQAAGVRFQHVPRFLAAFRVYPEQKTHSWRDIGEQEQHHLRNIWVRPGWTHRDIKKAIGPYLLRQTLLYYAHRIGLVRR